MEPLHSDWKPLYRVAATAALIVAALIPIQAILFIASPPPTTVGDYFTLFQHNRLLGLLDLDLLMIVDEVVMVPLLLAFYIALRRAGPSSMLIATALGLLAIAFYCFSREATFTMASLSDQYAAAATEAQRAMLLAAGQTLLAIYNGTNFDLYYILGAIGSLITAIVMLRSQVFSRATGWLGLLTGLLMTVPPTVGMIGLILAMLSLLPLMVWLIMVGRRLFQLARVE